MSKSTECDSLLKGRIYVVFLGYLRFGDKHNTWVFYLQAFTEFLRKIYRIFCSIITIAYEDQNGTGYCFVISEVILRKICGVLT